MEAGPEDFGLRALLAGERDDAARAAGRRRDRCASGGRPCRRSMSTKDVDESKPRPATTMKAPAKGPLNSVDKFPGQPCGPPCTGGLRRMKA